MTKKKKGGASAIAKAMQMVEEIRDNMQEGETFEDLDPQAHEAVGIILGIMRGKIKGRHLNTRLHAAITVLYQYRGRPTQKTEVDVGGTLADLITESMKLDGPKRKALPEPEPIDVAIVEDEPLEGIG